MAEMAEEHQVRALLEWTRTGGWWIGYSVGLLLWYLALVLVFLLQLLYWPIAVLLQPLIYLGRFVLACLTLPFAIAIRLETIYIYLGVAAIVGILGGVTVRGLHRTLQHLLRLDEEPPALQGRTVKQYRDDRRKRKPGVGNTLLASSLSPSRALSPESPSPGTLSMSDGSRKGRRGRGLLAQTIHEEIDSDF